MVDRYNFGNIFEYEYIDEFSDMLCTIFKNVVFKGLGYYEVLFYQQEGRLIIGDVEYNLDLKRNI